MYINRQYHRQTQYIELVILLRNPAIKQTISVKLSTKIHIPTGASTIPNKFDFDKTKTKKNKHESYFNLKIEVENLKLN